MKKIRRSILFYRLNVWEANLFIHFSHSDKHVPEPCFAKLLDQHTCNVNSVDLGITPTVAECALKAARYAWIGRSRQGWIVRQMYFLSRLFVSKREYFVSALYLFLKKTSLKESTLF